MSKIQLPPKRSSENKPEEKTSPIVNEKKIQEIINKGGSPVKSNEPISTAVKNFNLTILESDLITIGELCNMRPKKPGRVIGFSKKDWFLEAIQEKIDREKEKYNM